MTQFGREIFRDEHLPSTYSKRDIEPSTADTQPMNDITRDELSSTLSAIEERMDKRMDRADQQAQQRAQDVKAELALRDASFRSEQALRDKAADERFQSFLLIQAERDKRLDESISGIRDDISRLGSLKLSIWGAMFTGLAITLTVIGLAVTTYQAGQADRRPAETPPAPATPATAPPEVMLKPAPPATPGTQKP